MERTTSCSKYPYTWNTPQWQPTNVILKQMVERVIGAGQQVHDEHDGAQANVQQRLHGDNLGDQYDWVPLGVPEAGLHCVALRFRLYTYSVWCVCDECKQ